MCKRMRILARTHYHARAYARALGLAPSQWCYVQGPESLRALLRGSPLHAVQGWRLRSDVSDLVEAIEARSYLVTETSELWVEAANHGAPTVVRAAQQLVRRVMHGGAQGIPRAKGRL